MQLQKLVRDIFKSEHSKTQFESDPESFISRYALTAQEKRAVLNLQTTIGVVGSDTPQMAAAIEPMSNWS